MEDTLRRFGEQFDWQPVVEQGEGLRSHKHYIVAGMGGSHLGAWLIKKYADLPNITIHRNYGLPALPPDQMQDTLVILSSYSGTTEEVLDAGRTALEHHLPCAAIATGGTLLEFAKAHSLPYIQIPDTGLEPRMAVGFSMLALSRIMMNTTLEANVREAGKRADPIAGRTEGARIGGVLRGKIPVTYVSAANAPIGFIWKIKFNETAKIPSFFNVFPEMCHNELTGFDVVDSTRPISERFHVLMLEDFSDNPRIVQRMYVAGEMLHERGIPVERIPLAGKTGFEKALNAALLADWIALELAHFYGVPNPETPMVAEFKKRIGQ